MDKDWLNHPAMQNIAPEKKEILLEFMNNADGLSMDKAMALYMSTNKKLKEKGLTFTNEESELITQILTSNMTPAELKKLDMVKNMLQKKKK